MYGKKSAQDANSDINHPLLFSLATVALDAPFQTVEYSHRCTPSDPNGDVGPNH